MTEVRKAAGHTRWALAARSRATKVGSALVVGWGTLAAFFLASRNACADESASTAVPLVTRPPPPRQAFLQYGVAFTVEGVAAPGPICADASNPCILGSGGGIAVRVGWRPTEGLYIGGAYEFSKQDPSKLYRLAILQQARGELRRYFPTGYSITPFALLGLGLAAYGNEWSVDTWGPAGTLGGGIEAGLSGASLIGVALVYRPVYFPAYVDSSTLSHDSGVAHFIGLELAVEARDAL